MILLTSLILGLCMGSGVVFSQLYGEGNMEKLKTAMTNAFCLIAALSLLLMVLSYALLNAFISLLRVPQEAVPDITSYLLVIFRRAFSSRSSIISLRRFCAASAIPLRRCCSCCSPR